MAILPKKPERKHIANDKTSQTAETRLNHDTRVKNNTNSPRFQRPRTHHAWLSSFRRRLAICTDEPRTSDVNGSVRAEAVFIGDTMVGNWNCGVGWGNDRSGGRGYLYVGEDGNLRWG